MARRWFEESAAGDRPDETTPSAPSEAWLFAQDVLGKPVVDRESLRDFVDAIAPPRYGEKRRGPPSKELAQFVRALRGETEDKESLRQFVRDITGQSNTESIAPSTRDGAGDSAGLAEGTYDPTKHPRGGDPRNRGYWSKVAGPAGSGSDGSTGANRSDGSPPVPPRPTLNPAGIEVAGKGPETTQRYRDKVQKALETLDPDVARWWKANSISGQIRSRAAWFFQFKHRSWLEANDQPVVEVDQNMTPGEAAQAILAEVKGGFFADSLGAFYKKYRYLRRGDLKEFREWQKGAVAEAGQLASVLAELYVGSIATLTPAGDLVVTLGDVAENGPRWDQLMSILPYVGHLPIAAIVIKLGNQEIKLPKYLARKLGLLTDAEQKAIIKELSTAVTDEDRASMLRRFIDRIVGERQIHHPITDRVHKALEKHQNLKGKYKLRDKRFETLAKDLESHVGYQEWHRELDTKVENWLKDNPKATEATFEQWLREQYNNPDLKSRFPKSF